MLANGNPTYIGDIEKLTSRLAKQIAPFLHKITSRRGLDHQQLTMKTLLKNPTLKQVVLNLMMNSKQYETTFEIVDNMRGGWLGIKGCHNVDELGCKNVVSSMVVSNSTPNLIATGQLIGVNLRILSKGQNRIV